MDRLEEWGVLKKPEDIGIVPEFVLPSMLTPKAEENEWRLVTDFTPLNTHIKNLETVSATIKDARGDENRGLPVSRNPSPLRTPLNIPTKGWVLFTLKKSLHEWQMVYLSL